MHNQCMFSLLNIFNNVTQLILDRRPIQRPASIAANLDNAKQTIDFLDTLFTNYDTFKNKMSFVTDEDTMENINIIKNSLGIFYHLLAQKNSSIFEENLIEINILNRILYLYCDFINTYFLKK